MAPFQIEYAQGPRLGDRYLEIETLTPENPTATRSGFLVSAPFVYPYPEYHVRRRRGFSLIELMAVVAIIAIIAATIIPAVADLRTRSGLRSARTLLVSAFSAARAAAVQKGKTATVSLSDGALTVTAMSGLRPAPVQIQGPVNLSRTTGAALAPLAGAPTEVVYDARGLITPTTGTVARYELRLGARADTVCVTGAGTILPKGCVL